MQQFWKKLRQIQKNKKCIYCYSDAVQGRKLKNIRNSYNLSVKDKYV